MSGQTFPATKAVTSHQNHGGRDIREVGRLTLKNFILSSTYNTWLGISQEKDVEIAIRAIVDKLYAISAGSLCQGTITPPCNYPAGTKNSYWFADAKDIVGGAGGRLMEIGDMLICIADSVGGTHAAVGANYMIVEKNFYIGVWGDLTPLTRAVGQLVADGSESLITQVNHLDTAIGADASLTPVLRTAGPVSTAVDIYTNMDALDAAIGADVTSFTYLVAANNVNTNLDNLDTQLGILKGAGSFGGYASAMVPMASMNPILYWAQTEGTAGNTIRVRHIDLGAPGPIAIVVAGTDIDVSFQAGVETNAAIAAAVNADPAASALVYARSSGGNGEAAAYTLFSMGSDDLSYDADPSTNHINGALSLKDADRILDAKIGPDSDMASEEIIDSTNSMYKNFSLLDELVNIMFNKYYWKEDFNEEVDTVLLSAGLRADEWTLGGTNHVAANITYRAVENGVIRLQTSGADNDSECMSHIPAFINTTNLPVIEVRFRTDNVGAAQNGVLLGFANAAPIIDINNISGVALTYNLVGINSDLANPEHIRVFSGEMVGGDVIDDTGVALVANQWCTVRLSLEGVNPRIWINVTGGVITEADEVVLTTPAGVVTPATAMVPVLFVQGLDATPSDAALEVDYIRVWQNRA